jgi:hypothetical protein
LWQSHPANSKTEPNVKTATRKQTKTKWTCIAVAEFASFSTRIAILCLVKRPVSIKNDASLVVTMDGYSLKGSTTLGQEIN